MIARLFLLIGAVLVLAACGGPEEDWPPASPALWEVTGPGGARGWLFGTVHALPSGVDWRTEAVEQALDSSDLLVVEIVNLNDREAAVATFERLAYSPGLPALSRRVAAHDRPALERFMDRAGMDDADFAEVESWAAALRLANAVRDHDGEGVDRALLDGNDRVVGLESFGAQYQMFDRLSPQDQSDLLLGLARDADLGANDGRLRAWIAGDLDELERQSEVGILAHPRLREELLTVRNRAWAEQVDRLLASGERPFVAVGAAHLLWEDGLPELLVSRGYEVARVQ